MGNTVATKKPESQEARSSVGRPLLPWRESSPLVSRMRDEFERWFNLIAPDWPTLWEGASGKGWRWGVDMEEKDDSLIVHAEAPGFEPGDFDVQVEDNRLVLRASRKTETKDKESQSVREQQCYQSISLPCGIDKDKVEASYHHGILTVTMPKTPEAKGRKVPVKAK